MTGYAGHIITLRVDLNRLRGDKIVTRRDFVVGEGDMLPSLREGDVVRLIEEEGDTYLGVVEQVEDLLVHLWVDLESWTPAVEITGEKMGLELDEDRQEMSGVYDPKTKGTEATLVSA